MSAEPIAGEDAIAALARLRDLIGQPELPLPDPYDEAAVGHAKTAAIVNAACDWFCAPKSGQ